MADLRIPILLSINANVRFLSCEPLLESLILWPEWRAGLDWIICGGESGAFARHMDSEWARQLRYDCQAAGVAFFMKQMGGVRDARSDLDDLPPDLRVREFPT